MPSRPDRVALVAGTATEVGKTWVATAVLDHLRAGGVTVAARKPVQSFDPAEIGTTDAMILATASGEPAVEVCLPHRSLPVAMAPPMAAEVLGLPQFSVAELVDELRWPADVAVGLVESVGGVRSPLADDGDTVTLADQLAPDLVMLVADAGLGTINAVRLAVAALARHQVVTFLNRYDDTDDLHCRNRAWLAERDGFAVTTVVADLAVVVGARRDPH